MNKCSNKIDQAVHFLEKNIEDLNFISYDSEIMEMEQDVCVQIVNFLFKGKNLKILLGFEYEDFFVSMPQGFNRTSEFKLDQIDEIYAYALLCISESKQN